jgi:hypothetical protein
VHAIVSLTSRPTAVSWGVALLSLIVPPAAARSFGQQANPKVSVDVLSPSPVDRSVNRSAHVAETYGTPQAVVPPSAPPDTPAPPVTPVYRAAPQAPIVVSPSPTPVMIQPAPTTVLIGQTPPPNIIYAGSSAPQTAPNLMLLSPPQPSPLMAVPSPQGTTTSASVQYLVAQPIAPQPPPQVTTIVLRQRGPICSTLGAIGRSLAKLGQPTVELSPPLQAAPMLSTSMQQPAPVAAPVAPAPLSVVTEPPRPSPQSEPSHRWKWFRH